MAASVYVVTAPASIRGLYPTWPACEAKVKGVTGAKYQRATPEQAAQLLAGQPTPLPSGLYVFTDGNARGGIGIVRLFRGAATSKRDEISTQLTSVFPNGVRLADGDTIVSVEQALEEIQNIAAELGAAYHALDSLAKAKPGTALTLVADYAGVEGWLARSWKKNHPIVEGLVVQIEALIAARQFTVTYQTVKGHQSEQLATLDELVRENRRADALATTAAGPAPAPPTEDEEETPRASRLNRPAPTNGTRPTTGHLFDGLPAPIPLTYGAGTKLASRLQIAETEPLGVNPALMGRLISLEWLEAMQQDNGTAEFREEVSKALLELTKTAALHGTTVDLVYTGTPGKPAPTGQYVLRIGRAPIKGMQLRWPLTALQSVWADCPESGVPPEQLLHVCREAAITDTNQGRTLVALAAAAKFAAEHGATLLWT